LLVFASTAAAETGITNIVDGVMSNYTGSFLLGSNGAFNELIVTNAGELNVTNRSIIGNSAASSNNYALVTGAGSLWSNSGSLYVGYSGAGNQLTITNGGSVVAVSGVLGYNYGATGNSVWVSGSDSSWRNTGELWSGELLIGRVGAGNLLAITDGGSVFSSMGTVGKYAGADNNSVLVSGAGSVWSNSGALWVGRNGAGNQLAITDGGKVFNAGGMIGENSNNDAVLVSGSNSLWSNSGDLWIGAQGSGNRLTISNGATVLDASGIIGVNTAAGNNTVLVSGLGSVWSNSSYLYVGQFGFGNELTITDGANVFSGNGAIGVYAGANSNAVLVSGTGSFWKSTALLVGQSSFGNRLTISDGGQVLDVYAAIVGYNASASNNLVAVSGAASVWSNSGDIWVGRYGSGNQLAVTNGASALSANGSIGVYTGANTNVALVSGNGSVWRNSGSLFVGYSGAGNQLAVAEAGAVAATNIVIGVADTSTGNLITVSDGYVYATNATRTGALDIRRGALALNSGTAVVNQLYATNGSSSVVNFNGGTLQSGGSTVNNGSVFTVGDGSSAATLQLAGGSHSFASGLFINSNAWLTGTGAITGAITNAGAIAIGDPLGILTGSSDLTLLDSSLLLMQLAGTNAWLYDQINIGGAFTFGGTLTLSLLDGFTPFVGNRFDLFDFTSSTGFFTTTNLPTLDPLLYWDLNALYTTGEIEVDWMPFVITGLQLGASNAVSQNIVWTLENTSDQPATNIVRYWLAGSGVVLSEGVSSLPGTNTITVTLTNLLDNSTYYYWVQSSNTLASVSAPADSPGYNPFTTPKRPIKITSSTPVRGTVNPVTRSTTLSWDFENNTATNAAQHVVHYTWDGPSGGGEAWTSPVMTGSGVSQVSVAIGGLQAGATYNATAYSCIEGYTEQDPIYSWSTPGGFTISFEELSPIVISNVTSLAADTLALVEWDVTKADTNALAYHFVITGTNATINAGSSVVVTEGVEDNGQVMALLEGLTPDTNYCFYVQSVIAFTNGLFATDNNGGSFYPLTTLAATNTIIVTTNSITISSVSNLVSGTDALITWSADYPEDQWASHFVLWNMDTPPTPASYIVAPAAEYDFGKVASILSGLPLDKTIYFAVQSAINHDPTSHVTDDDFGDFYHFVTPTTTNGAIVITWPTGSGNVISSGQPPIYDPALDPTADPDGDGLNNAWEWVHGTDPFSWDTDGDGLSDDDEINVYYTDPLKADSDDDGLTDDFELLMGTEPDNPDTDGDEIPDGWEFLWDLDPDDSSDAELKTMSALMTNLDYFGARTNAFATWTVGFTALFEPSDRQSSSDVGPATVTLSWQGAGLWGSGTTNVSDLISATGYWVRYYDSEDVEVGPIWVSLSEWASFQAAHEDHIIDFWTDWSAGGQAGEQAIVMVPGSGEGYEFSFTPLSSLDVANGTVTSWYASWALPYLFFSEDSSVFLWRTNDFSKQWGFNGENQPPAQNDETTWTVYAGCFDILTDFDRNGEINGTDKTLADQGKVFHFWYNDDNDAGGTSGDDIPMNGPKEIWDGTTTVILECRNGMDDHVNGVRDLVDFFPVWIDLRGVKDLPDKERFEVWIVGCCNIVTNTSLSASDCQAYLKNSGTAASLGNRSVTQLGNDNGRSQVSPASWEQGVMLLAACRTY
jgi:T5SS/PEP-CTERM-associated repeat protein